MTGRKDPENSGEYTEHLEVLRRKILSVLLFFFFSAVLLFLFSEHTAAFLLAPLEGLGVSLYYFRPYEKLLTYMRLAFWGGIVLASPLALVQCCLFVWPALRRNEAKFLLMGGGVAPYCSQPVRHLPIGSWHRLRSGFSSPSAKGTISFRSGDSASTRPSCFHCCLRQVFSFRCRSFSSHCFSWVSFPSTRSSASGRG